MLFWVILTVVVVVLIYLVWEALDVGEYLAFGFGTIIVGAFVFIAVGFIAFISGANDNPDTHETESVVYSLEPLSDGTFIQTNEDDVVYYYEDDGWIQMETVETESSRIARDSTELDAHVRVIDVESNLWWWAPWPHNSTTVYEFHIPEDTTNLEKDAEYQVP